MFEAHESPRHGMELRACTALLAACCVILLAVPAVADEDSFTLFESGQVRPLAMSPDGTRLFALNTPDDRLEIFDIGIGSLTHAGSVLVGMEPVAVAALDDDEVWVVNHLSDSVSIVDVSSSADAHVVRTLLVGDEPRDIVFAGGGGDRAFITCAHRGQNTPHHASIIDELRTEGIGRADVWVFDTANLGSSLGGDELTIVELFGDTPRALAVSPDGGTVYAAVFHSGNQTTTVTEGIVSNNGGLPSPTTNFQGVSGPSTGLIVKYDGSAWRDELNRSWSSQVRFNLPDEDVFAINANANPPVQIGGPSGVFAHVGTILFNMAVNPMSGKVYVSNTEALNDVRFEGPGIYASGFKPVGEPPSVLGHLHESRITVLDGSTVTSRHLNKHVDYTSCCAPIPNAENAASLAFPLDMAVTSDGSTLYVSAFGSSKIGIFDTAELESDSFVPDPADHISVPGGGPTGLVIDEDRTQLYVLTRFDDAVAILNPITKTQVVSVPLHNPEPASVVIGRPFLYDAAFTSSHGDSACASCHVFANFDSLAWDLGNPDETVVNNPGPFTLDPQLFFQDPDFHPMKGPMTTQSLRGMANHGPMHWRGDRTGGNATSSSQPDSGTFDEDAAFKAFNPAFVGLIGRSQQLLAVEMQAFTDFILQVTYPPNPIRNLDNSLTAEQQDGRTFYHGPNSDTFFDCNGCHVLNPSGNAGFGVAKPGFFGTDGRSSFEGEPQVFKIPQLRNMYQKVGMFGMASAPFFDGGDDHTHQGDQVRGFGFIHDGSVDTLFRFHGADVFSISDQERRDAEAFILAFDSNLAPIVGQQITRSSTNGATADPRITLLIARASAGECDLIAKGTVAGEARGYLFESGQFTPDRAAEPSVSDATLRAAANTAGQEITYTCTPPGNGVRLGLDRDEDGHLDRDELDAGSDPADPTSVPGVCGNGVKEIGEDCDSGDLDGQTCLSLGFAGGSLVCDGQCAFDTSGCLAPTTTTTTSSTTTTSTTTTTSSTTTTSTTTTSTTTSTTTTTTTSTTTTTLPPTTTTTTSTSTTTLPPTTTTSTTSTTSTSTTTVAPTTTTSTTTTTVPPTTTSTTSTTVVPCGNGAVDGGEDCDGVNLDGQTCTSLGFAGGVLGCDATCSFDTSACATLHGPFTTRTLKLTRLTKPAGAQVVALKSFDLDGGAAIYNPLEEALTVRIDDGGATVWEATIPAGDPDWKLRNDKLKWRAKSAAHPAGLKNLRLGISGQPFTLKAKAKDASIGGVAGVSPLGVTLIVGDDGWLGPTFPCNTSSSGNTVKCR